MLYIYPFAFPSPTVLLLSCPSRTNQIKYLSCCAEGKQGVREGEETMFQKQLVSSSSLSRRESLRIIEVDIHHANTMAAAIQRIHGGVCIQMRLSYSSIAPLLFFLIRWMDLTCVYNLPSYLGLLDVLVYKVYVDGKSSISSYERRAGLQEFYGVIYPSLQQLESTLTEMEEDIISGSKLKIAKNPGMLSNKVVDEEDECGICMETCSKMVLPNCNHSMCINCYHDWNTRSRSCPFCRGSLKRVASRDLWVLTTNRDVIDTMSLVKENLKSFYLYINKLPLAIPDSLFVGYYEYLI